MSSLTEARTRRNFPFALITSFWQRSFLIAGLLTLVGILALGSSAPSLAAYQPTFGSGGASGNASETPSTPTTTQVRPEEGEEAPTENDPQYSERDTSTDNTWIVIAVVLMIILTVLGFGLAALGLSAE